jgi:hypothetical protein
MDAFFTEWHQRFDLTQFRLFEIETTGRYDVRIAESPEQIGGIMRPGDRLLTATRMSGLELVAEQHPYYLYELRDSSPKNIRPLYTLDITAELTYGWPLGVSPGRQTRIMLGQPVNLPAGRYRATVYLNAGANDRLAAEVVGERTQNVLAQSHWSAAGTAPLLFTTRGDTPLRFRLRGPDMHHASLRDVVVTFIGPNQDALQPYPPTGAVTRQRGNGPLASEFYPSCGPLSLNGAAQAPMFTVGKREGIDIQGWTPVRQAGAKVEVQFQSSAHGNFWLSADRSARNQYGLVSFRAVGRPSSLPADTYRIRPVRIEDGEATSCAEFWNLTIAPDGGAPPGKN